MRAAAPDLYHRPPGAGLAGANRDAHNGHKGLDTAMEDYTRLQKSAIFNGFDEDAVRYIAALGRVESVQGGNVIFRQGEPGNYLYVVLEGSVSIYCGDKCIAKCRALEAFGEMAAFRARQRSATARAVTDVRLLVLDQEAVGILLDGPHAVPFLLNVIDVLGQRLEAGNTWIVSSLDAQRRRS
jgi:CRP/FNR family cyclic AMP-dependent transcriptional regulator